MGITERHLFENEEPELTDQQLEDIVYENKKAYDRGYIKGYNDAVMKCIDVVRCKDCKYRPKEPDWETYGFRGSNLEFPEGSECPCRCAEDTYYSWYPKDDWFCPRGKRKEG